MKPRVGASATAAIVLAALTVALVCATPSVATGGWTVQPSGTSRNLEGVSFADQRNGFAVGQHATILRTKDGGATWQSLPSPLPSDTEVGDVEFTTPLDGWVIGTYNVSLHTIDGGATWKVQECLLLYPMWFYALSSVDAQHTWIATSNTLGYSILDAQMWRGLVIGTDNGGKDWWASPQLLAEQLDPGTAIFGIDFVDLFRGWMISFNGGLFRTTDGGRTWTDVSPAGIGAGSDVSFCDASNGWAVGDTDVFHTTNGGQTWTTQATGVGLDPSTNTLRAVAALDPSTCWVVGDGGVVIHTTDGGQNWSVETPTSANLYDVCFVGAGTVWAVGDGGVILKHGASTPAPTITTLTPTHGLPGSSVTIGGSNLGTSGTVLFGTTPAAARSWSASSITCGVPSLPGGPVSVTVTTGGQTSPPYSFTVDQSADPPVLSALLPTTGAAGATVVVTGSNLGSSGTLKFGSVTAATSTWAPTAIVCTVPAGLSAGAVSVTVTTSGGTSNALSFTVSGGSEDTVGPACAARNVTVKRGKSCKIYFKVYDALSAQVTTDLRITTKSGAVKRRWRWDYDENSASWWYVTYKCTLAKGSYRIVVSGTDLAGNPASKIGRATLTVK